MANTIPSANMSLPIPVVGVDPGPTWADDINSCLTIVDSHDHSAGSGVVITPSGININADLSMNNSNLTAARTVRFTSQNTAPAQPTDLGCLSVVDVDLYFNDVSGNVVRITQSGGVAGSPGSIANLTSPASATYVAADATFVWESDVATPASMDGGSVILRNILPNSKGLTLNPPAAMGSNYSLTLPSLPGQTNLMSLDTGGNMGASINVDNSTIEISSSIIQVKDGGITQAKLASISSGTTALAGQLAQSNSSGNFSSTSGSNVSITNLSVTITTLGRPVMVWCEADGSGSNAKMGVTQDGVNPQISASFSIFRDAVLLTKSLFETNGWTSGHASSVSPDTVVPPSCLRSTDVVAAGTYVYSVKVACNATNSRAVCAFARLYAKEM